MTMATLQSPIANDDGHSAVANPQSQSALCSRKSAMLIADLDSLNGVIQPAITNRALHSPLAAAGRRTSGDTGVR